MGSIYLYITAQEVVIFTNVTWFAQMYMLQRHPALETNP